MTPKSFLTYGGIVLVLVGILGFFLIGPTAEQSIFGELWWFDNPENIAHLVLGIVALIAAFAAPASVQKPLVMVVGVVALFFTLYNFFSEQFLGANLESPMDLILHLVVAVWAFMSTKGKEA